MLTNPTAGRRLTGRLAVFAAVAIALPLTATRAVEYVDKLAPAAPAPAASPAPTAEAAPVAQPAVVAAPAPVAPVAPLESIDVGKKVIVINGQTKHWDDLTPVEKAEIRQQIAKARSELAQHKIDGKNFRIEIQKAMNESKVDQAELQRELAEARVEIAEAMREIDAHSAEMRRAGVDPEALKASIHASLKGVENIDVEAIRRNALSSVDVDQIEATVEKALEQAEAELDRIDDLDDDKDDD